MREPHKQSARPGDIIPPALYVNPDNPRALAAVNHLQRRSHVRVDVRPISALQPPTCATCGGDGTVLHPDWAKYYHAFPSAHAEPEDPAGWFLSQSLIEHRDDLPPQRQICPDCDGPTARPRRVAHG